MESYNGHACMESCWMGCTYMKSSELISSLPDYLLFEIQKDTDRSWETLIISSFSKEVSILLAHTLTLQNYYAKVKLLILFSKCFRVFFYSLTGKKTILCS